MTTAPRMSAGTRRFAILCVLGYVAASWALRFDTARGAHNASLTYPLDTYAMYAESMPDDVARVVVRTADGTYRGITEYRAFRCDPPLDVTRRCDAGGTSIGYVDDDAARWVADHAGSGPERIEIVQRSFSLAGGRATATSDCVLTTCTASP